MVTGNGMVQDSGMVPGRDYRLQGVSTNINTKLFIALL